MIKKAQATLEFTLIFVLMAALLMGLIGLWKWSSDNIIRRQLNYNTTRVGAGSGTGDNSVINTISTGFTDSDVKAYLDSLGVQTDPSSGLTPEQINSYLDRVNQAISALQDNITTLQSSSDTWQSNLDYTRQQEADIQKQIQDLKAELADKQKELEATPDVETCSEDGCVNPHKVIEEEIKTLNQDLEKAKNGYYTTMSQNCGDSGCKTTYTYDYSNAQWMNKFGTRDAWAQDYWAYQQYGSSQGNNYGLYANYTAGLLDWQARATYAQSQLEAAQFNLSNAGAALAQAASIRDKLEAAKSQA